MSRQLSLAEALVDGRLGSNDKLARIDALIEWPRLESLLSDLHRGQTGRPPYPALAMLKALYLQALYDLSDPGLEEALLDRLSFRRFCGFALDAATPDETTICRFRLAAAQTGTLERCFAEVNRQLDARGLMLKKGTLMDASIVAATHRPPRREAGMGTLHWDELVQEDRVHRLIYTDPAIFAAEMTHIFGAVWVYLGAREPDPEERRLHHHAARAAADHPVARLATARSARCSIAAPIAARRSAARTRARRASSQCPYHGWSYLNTGKLRAVPWPDGYACDFKDAKFNVAQVPRVDSYRGFIFGTLNPDAPPLLDYLGAITKPIDEWLDRNPGGKVAVCEANRLKFKGNWKLAYDNSGDGYHVVFSHRSLLEMENRLADEANKGMSYYKGSPDTAPMYMRLYGQRPSLQGQAARTSRSAPADYGRSKAAHPGMEHYARRAAPRFGAAPRSSRSRLLGAGQHQRVSQPLAARQPHPGVRAGLGR
jgi:IS5 family transposase